MCCSSYGSLQRLSSELTKQVNEEIGDLRELDPSYHMKELMEDEEEDEKVGQGSRAEVDGGQGADFSAITAGGWAHERGQKRRRTKRIRLRRRRPRRLRRRRCPI